MAIGAENSGRDILREANIRWMMLSNSHIRFQKLTLRNHILKKRNQWKELSIKELRDMILLAQSVFQIRLGIPSKRNERPSAFHVKPSRNS